ncbi:hypothetical protein D3C75_1133780 [compost metagenome]
MRRVYEHRAEAMEKAARGQRELRERYNKKAVARIIQRELNGLVERFNLRGGE